MPLEHLERDGILRPREEWGGRRPESNVARVPLLAAALLVPVAAALMFLGDGGVLTWVGLALYFVFLVAFTVISLRGIR
jgi:hypothetical protein